MPKPALRLLLLSGLAYALMLSGLALLNGRLLILAIPLVVYLAASLLNAPHSPRLSVTRRLSDQRVSHGTPVTVTASITNEGTHLEEVFIEDTCSHPLDLLKGETRLFTSLAPGATVELEYTLRAARGVYRFHDVGVIAGEPLGLAQRQTTLAAAARLIVLPDAPGLRRIAIRPRQTRVYSGLIPARRGGQGVEFFGVRDYQPGDALRWIDWNASARHPDALFTTEFEQERVADVGLILDARQRSHVRTATTSLFESAVQATAALAQLMLNDGNRVGLLVYGAFIDWTVPGYGKAQRERVLQSLARAELGDSLVFDNLDLLPARLFPPESQLILISPLVKEDRPVLIRLRARGYQLIVVSPDPIPLAVEKGGQRPAIALSARIARAERTLLLRQLQQAGIRVVDWRIDTPIDQAIHRALRRASIGFRGARAEWRR